eukprot:1363240-Rhodomonas_salina.1
MQSSTSPVQFVPGKALIRAAASSPCKSTSFESACAVSVQQSQVVGIDVKCCGARRRWDKAEEYLHTVKDDHSGAKSTETPAKSAAMRTTSVGTPAKLSLIHI